MDDLMSTEQMDAYLDQIAKLIKASATTVEDAIQIVLDAKIRKGSQTPEE